MNSEDISNAINDIDDEMIESVNKIRKPKKSISRWIKWSAAAAAIAVIGFAGARAFIYNEPNISEPIPDYLLNSETDNPNSTDGIEQEYGNIGTLPLIVYEEAPGMAYGWEGYMAYDISELDNGNPWNEDVSFETLPVFRNNSYTEFGIAYPGIGEEAMNKKLENIAETLNLDIQEIVKFTLGEYTSGTGLPDDFVDRIEADFGNFTVEIQSNGSIVAMYNGLEGASLPEEYSFTYCNTSEGEAYKTIAYLYENYSDFIDIDEPTFVSWADRTYDGSENRDYRIYDFSGDEIDDMLSFAFSGVQLAPNDEGKLMLIRINDHLSCAEKIGDYPIISVDEAKEKLLDGEYITTSPYELPDKKYIATTELIYRSSTSENIWMPYYRFLVEIPDSLVSNNTPQGLKEFCAYYVPAVKSEYITGLPLWNGRFN